MQKKRVSGIKEMPRACRVLCQQNKKRNKGNKETPPVRGTKSVNETNKRNK